MLNTQFPLIQTHFLKLQQDFCKQFATVDEVGIFIEDVWSRVEGGGGITRILKNGAVIEQGGVNYSNIEGNHLPPSATLLRPELNNLAFKALGISVVIHPENPYVPTAHANLRFFMTNSPTQEPIWWFGGGFDLTPYYPFKEDCIYWHQMAKLACEPFGSDIYPKFKKQCDEYFYLKHRNEARGIGGIFFDDLNEKKFGSFETCFAFIKAVGEHFINAYTNIIAKRKNHPYTTKERAFQCYRRGRYVEFNLIYDRGTLFGLQSGGRTESILMSLPPEVSWQYNWQPEMDSAEYHLTEKFLKPQEWL